MYPQTKAFIRRQLVKLIQQTDDKEHAAGRVTIGDIKTILNEMEEK